MRSTRAGGVVGCSLLVLAGAVAPAPVHAAHQRGGGSGASPGCSGGPGWELVSDKPDPDYSAHPYVGNGNLSQRVPAAGTGYAADGGKTGFPLETPRYGGAFTSGLYSAADSAQSEQKRHAYAALPTWSTLAVGVGDQEYGPAIPPEEISNYRQTLNMRCGLVRTSLTWTARDGRATDLVYEIVADRAKPEVGAVRVRMTPHWDGEARVTDAIDGTGARRMHATGSAVDDRSMRVNFETDGVGTAGTVASTLRPDPRARTSGQVSGVDGLTARRTLDLPVQGGQSYEFSKYVGVNTAHNTPDPEAAASRASREAADQGWDELFREHARQWLRLWDSDIRVPGRPRMQEQLRSSQYQTLSSVRAGQDDSVAPAGLSSDNYGGAIFWDTELWIYPNLLQQHPEIARSVVDYRERMLPAARENARSIGQQGAFYPWTSADTGDLEADCHSWKPPHCVTQNHLQSDVALAVWQYYQATGDRTWLREHGWPMLRELATYWEGRVTPNQDGSYSINNVAGPDEYSNGVDDGVFTNAGAALTLRNAAEAARLVGEPAPPQWNRIADGLRIPFDRENGVFRQYEGYAGQQIKQADSVLLQYPLQQPMSRETASRTLDYYAPRTDADGPAMTDAVHAIDAAQIGKPGCAVNTYLDRSIRPFVKEPFAQFSEARGKQAGENAGPPTFNFLTGAGGFTQTFMNGLTGMRLRTDGVELDPMLPPQLPHGTELTGLHWQGRTYDVRVGPRESTVTLRDGAPFTVHAPDGDHLVSRDRPLTLETRRPDLEPTNNLARCRSAVADSEEEGRYAEAAVDGDEATPWLVDGDRGSMTADLGGPRPIHRIEPQWTETAPSSHRLLTSVDGEHFTEVPAELPEGHLARYVRVEVTGPQQPPHTGLRELRVE